jgi:membrane fusion protein (multidrug efflux system)
MIRSITSRHVLRFFLLLVVPLSLCWLALDQYAQGGRYVETDNAYVKAHIVSVSAETGGRVHKVLVKDQQQVRQGDLLFVLDPAPFQIALAKASAQLEMVRNELDTLRAEYRVAKAEASEAQERIQFLNLQLERSRRLRELGMIRADAYDEALHQRDAARARLSAIEERASRVLTALGGDMLLAADRHPKVLEAKAALDEAKLALERTEIRASQDGTISNLRLRPGENINRGAGLFSLIQPDKPWIEANFKETQLEKVRVGQTASLVADAYPDRSWSAKVLAIAPATGAQFAVLPPQNATGNWVKVVQRVPVMLEIDPGGESTSLRAGMTVTVRVDTGKARGMPDLFAWLSQ